MRLNRACESWERRIPGTGRETKGRPKQFRPAKTKEYNLRLTKPSNSERLGHPALEHEANPSPHFDVGRFGLPAIPTT
jgi:hypothetical protein